MRLRSRSKGEAEEQIGTCACDLDARKRREIARGLGTRVLLTRIAALYAGAQAQREKRGRGVLSVVDGVVDSVVELRDRIETILF